jgi:4'-phosphopantetheinyl transferase
MALGTPVNTRPSHLALREDEIHLFWTSLDLSSKRMRQFAETLSADESSRAAHFHFDKDRNRFVAGRGTLREILSWLLQCPPDAVIFSYGAHGKPRLSRPEEGRLLYFNLAHSESLAVFAVSRNFEVGVDLERIRPVPEASRIVEDFFSESEAARWRSMPPANQSEFFFECWTRKEAYLKGMGEGFSGPFRSIEAFRVPHAKAGPPGLRQSAPIAADWFLYSLKPASGYLCAVAAKNHNLRLFNWNWDRSSTSAGFWFGV